MKENWKVAAIERDTPFAFRSHRRQKEKHMCFLCELARDRLDMRQYENSSFRDSRA